jgi:drug/metabolite transporter (DMT)-like permease
MSLSAIIIRLAESPAMTIATNRMLASVLLLLPFALPQARRDVAGVGRRDLLALTIAGTCLAAHFGTWTASLAYTSVASSVLFVSLHPVVVALVEWLALRRVQRLGTWIGIGLTLAGSVVVAAHDLQLGRDAIWGDALAFLGAVALVGYLIVGRSLRRRFGSLSYSTAVYAVCWLALLLWTVATGEDVRSFPPGDLLWFVLLALFATVGGHTVFNWALGHISASTVAVTFVAEPLVAALFAWAFLGEALALAVGIGGLIVLAGVYVTARAEST